MRHAPAALFVALIFLAVVPLGGCGSAGSTPTSPPCDQACQDGTAVRSLREAIKLAFNLTVQGKPVGAQDATVPCPLGGKAHVSGTATSNAVQGATDVTLTYDLEQCAYLQQDSDPLQSYNVVVTGTIKETGTLAVQSSATTALEFQGDSVTITGTVYDPPINYTATACAVQLGQNGNDLGGTMCGRVVGVTL